MKSLEQLTLDDLKTLKEKGHIGILTKDIAELMQFYNRVDNEIKRRELKISRLQRIIPINKHFYIADNNRTVIFTVLECEEISESFENTVGITHICRIEGFEVNMSHRMIQINNSKNANWQPFQDVLFGWNAKEQVFVYYNNSKSNQRGYYEVTEVSNKAYCDYVTMFSLMGLIEI